MCIASYLLVDELISPKDIDPIHRHVPRQDQRNVSMRYSNQVSCDVRGHHHTIITAFYRWALVSGGVAAFQLQTVCSLFIPPLSDGSDLLNLFL